MSEVPQSLPVHPRTRQRLHELSVKDISDSYNDTRRQLFETLQSLLADPGDTIEDQMNTLIKNYQSLCTLQASSMNLTARLANAKDSFRSLCEQCDPVDPLTWYQYASGELMAPRLVTLFQDEQSVSKEARLSREDVLLSALKYIWNDPTAMIPDEQNDDLYIEGGKIELHCPITYKPFETPMISKKCNHVFDRLGIENYLHGYPSRDCPQSGCSQKLTMSDFQEDDLMKLRCKIAKVKKKPTKTEALDVI